MAAAKTRQSKIGFPQSRGEREVSAKQKKSLAESQVDVYPPTTSQETERTSTKEEDELQILRCFDLTMKYGPCIGISRQERWKRAEKFGLDPPIQVYDILQSHQGDTEYTECLWNNEKGLTT